jgi:amino acid adenylation domain-containing protein
MELTKLIETLGRLNICLQVQGNELKIKGSKENLSPAIVEQVRRHKAELISYLGGEARQAAAAIPVVEATFDACYPLSSAQRRLWIMSQVEGSGIAYNIPGTYIFKGRLDTAALTRAFEQLIARHESLRTVFAENEQGEVKQRILSVMPFTINYHDLQQTGSPEDNAKAMVQQTLTTPFDLSSGPLLRADLFQLAEDKWVFTYVMHHIISDGWSMGVLIRELLALYNAFTSGADHSLPALRIQYKDYAAWQLQQLSGASLQAHRDWWLKQFAGGVPVLELPADNVRPAIKTFNGKIINRRLNTALTAELKAICRQQDATLFMGLLAVVNTLLHRYTGQDDIVIGSPIAGRDHPDLEGQIGFYVNTLALRTRFQEKQTFAELLSSVKNITLAAYEHQAYPFDELVNELNLQRDLSRHPLFDVMVVLQNAGGTAGEVNGLSVQEYKEIESLGSKFDWLFIFNESGAEIHVSIEYNADIYNEERLEQAWTHFEQLLAAIAAQPSKPVAELEYLSAAERNKLLAGFNDTAVEYPKEKTIAALFEEQAAKTPGKIALVSGDAKLSYRELNEQANRFAAYLLNHCSIQPDDLIAVKLHRNERLIIAILAVLKTGAAYVPIDPSYPQDRVDYMLADSNCKLLIDEQMFSASLPACVHNPVNAASPRSLAYVMYTSGSTGKPKGVMVEHRSVVRLVRSAKYAAFTGNETLLSTGAVSFDATTFEYWGMLLNGGTLVICSLETLLDADQLSALIQKEQVDTMWFTAGWFNQLVDKNISVFRGLKKVLAGGDKLSPAHVNAVLEQYPGIEIINGYGPTENTTFSLTYSITTPAQVIPVGKPISNSTAYIMDKNNQLCPVGVVGEICVGGDGLARGYLNQHELTAQKFVANPFAPGSTMYRTGDLGRWLPDGNILFEGRKDDQVKIRGYRIEPGEIEAVIQNNPAVDSVVVVPITNAAGEKELAAYIVSEVTVQDIRNHVAKELPAYMVPAYFIQLDELPLTPNGKVDRRNLPHPVAVENNATYVAPRNEIEEKLASIWQEILGRENIGVKAHFFECGGHSLKLTILSGQLQKVFGAVIALKDLFTNPVLEQQAELIRNTVKTAYHIIPAAPPQESYALSAAQRRLWILSQFRQSNIAYNVPSVYVFEGSLDLDALEHALHALVERHESLRTVFRQNESGEVRQYILPSIDASINHVTTEADILNDIGQPFDLAAGPLLRTSVCRVAANKWIFAHVMHHIICDAWSMNVLMNELLLFYNARIENRQHGLKPLRIHYKDYAAWQQDRLAGETKQKTYWSKQLEAPLPVLDLPQAKPRPARKTFAGATLQKNISANLKAFCLEHNSTLFMGLLAGVNALLYGYSKQQDIIIGTPIAGREHADLEGQVGVYINTLALRTRFSGNSDFINLLSLTKEVTLGAYEHQSYPFDELVEQLRIPRDPARSALFDVMVVLQNTGSSAPLPNPRNLAVSAYNGAQNAVSAFDLTFNFIEVEEQLIVSIEYNTDLFSKPVVLRMADHLEQLLQHFIQHPSAPLDSFSINPHPAVKPATKKQKLLIDDLEL